MENINDARIFLDDILDTIKENELDLEFPRAFYKAIEEGKSEKQQRQHFEYKKFDDLWIKTIEAYFPSIDRITKNLKTSLKYETEILPIEKTKKINPESIRHLTRNTQLIREIDENDNVIPQQVLNNLSEIEYGIYENRFIMTLIIKLKDYLYHRLSVIKTEMHGFKSTTFNYNNIFNFNNANYDLEINLKAKEVLSANKNDHSNLTIFERTERLYKLVSRLFHGEFMQIMKRFQPVKPPIMKTQIILKNPDFRNAYMLWLYLDKTHVLDYQLEVETKQKRFNQQYYQELNNSLLVLFSTIYNHSEFGNNLKDDHVYTQIKKPESSNNYNEVTTNVPEFDLEPQNASEFYLQKAKRLMHKGYREALKSEQPIQSLKQLLLDQYTMIDTLAENLMEINQDNDIFSQLVTYTSPEKMYEEAKRKYEITKAIRQLKEQMYNDAMKLENKWIKEFEFRQVEALKYYEEEMMHKSNEEISKVYKDIEKERLDYEKKLIKSNKDALAKQKVLNDIKFREAKLKFENDLKKFKEKERLRIKKEKELQKEKLQKQKEKMKLNALKEKEKGLKELNKQKQDKINNMKEQLQKEKAQFKAKNNIK